MEGARARTSERADDEKRADKRADKRAAGRTSGQTSGRTDSSFDVDRRHHIRHNRFDDAEEVRTDGKKTCSTQSIQSLGGSVMEGVRRDEHETEDRPK
jgi:hypothetical protein